jgi:hypothetical protein
LSDDLGSFMEDPPTLPVPHIRLHENAAAESLPEGSFDADAVRDNKWFLPASEGRAAVSGFDAAGFDGAFGTGPVCTARHPPSGGSAFGCHWTWTIEHGSWSRRRDGGLQDLGMWGDEELDLEHRAGQRELEERWGTIGLGAWAEVELDLEHRAGQLELEERWRTVGLGDVG